MKSCILGVVSFTVSKHFLSHDILGNNEMKSCTGSSLTCFILRNNRDGTTLTTNTDKQREHHHEAQGTHNRHKHPYNNPNHTTRPKGLTGNDGACRPPPWRPPNCTTPCPTPWRLPKSAYPGRGISLHGGRRRHPWGPCSIVEEAANVVHSPHTT
jgi:hypothetical protein